MAKRLSILLTMVFCLLVILPLMPTHRASAAESLRIYRYDTKKSVNYTDSQVKVTFNGKKISNDDAPGILIDNVALVPYKDIFAKSLIAAEYSYITNTVTLKKNGTTIVMKVGNKTAQVNGKAVQMPVAPVKIKYESTGKTNVLIPSRFVATTLGYEYTWNKAASTVEIKKNALFLSYSGKNVEYTSTLGNVTVDGDNISLGSMKSIIINNVAMLRAKRVFADSKVSAEYSYDKVAKTVTLKKNNLELVMTIDTKTAYLNGKKVTLDEAPVSAVNREDGSSYILVPGKCTAEFLGLEYVWDSTTKTSTITTKEKDESFDPGNDATDNNSGNTGNTDNSGSTGGTGNTDNSGSAGGTGNSGSTNNSGNSGNTGNSGNSGSNSGTDSTPSINLKDQYRLNNFTPDSSYQLYQGNDVTSIDGSVVLQNSSIYSVQCDMTSPYVNAEKYVIYTNSQISNVTSSRENDTVTLEFASTSVMEGIVDSYGQIGELVSKIEKKNIADTTNSQITFYLKDRSLNYDLELSPNGCDVYLYLYVDTIEEITIYTSEQGDCVVIEGVSADNVSITKMDNSLTINLDYTFNSIGYQSTMVGMAKHINNIFIVGNAKNYSGFLVNLQRDALYYTVTKGDTLYLYIGYGADQVQEETPAPTPVEPEPTVDYTVDEAINLHGYQIVIPKPHSVTADDVSHEDYYTNNKFVVRIKGDYVSYLRTNMITTNSSIVDNIIISLTSNNETEVEVTTTKLQGYKYDVGENYIYVKIGNPKEIYPFIVFLDAGHGDTDAGALYNGVKEKDLNYKILYTLGKKYFNNSDFKIKVYYSRWTDVLIPLQDRAALAKKYNADLFVSLHMNANTSSTPYGTEVYYSTNNNKANSAGLTSQKLASIFVDSITNTLGTYNRGTRAAKYTVVHNNTVPAVLIELGFMSNSSDFKKLTNAQFQENAAKCIYDTLCQVAKDYPVR